VHACSELVRSSSLVCIIERASSDERRYSLSTEFFDTWTPSQVGRHACSFGSTRQRGLHVSSMRNRNLEAKGGTWPKKVNCRGWPRTVTKHSQVEPCSCHRRHSQAHTKLKPLVLENSIRMLMVSASPANPALVLLIFFSSPSFALPTFHWPRFWTLNTDISKRAAPEEGYYSPLANGGSLLTVSPVSCLDNHTDSHI
jgi:hypothetical protein